MSDLNPKPVAAGMSQPVHHRYLSRLTALALAFARVLAPLPIKRSFQGAALN